MTRSTVLFVNTRPSPSEAEPCFRAARQLDLDVVLLADRPVAVPKGAYVEHVPVDSYDNQSLVAAAKACANQRTVTGVVCWGDRDVEGTAHIAAALGLPGHTPAAAAGARNKAVFRESLARAAPEITVRSRAIQRADREALASAASHVGFPAVLKPAGASSSKGIFRVDDIAALRQAVDQLTAYTRPEMDPIFRFYPGLALLEEFIEGSEHSVDGLLSDGELIAATVTDKWVEPRHSLEYMQVHPSALAQQTQDAALAAARSAASAIGLGTGAFHLEFRVAPNQSLRVLELNARTGGGYITSHLIPLSCGWNFLAATLALACQLEKPSSMPAPYAVAGSRKLIANREGRFRALDGIEKALSEPGICALILERQLGAEALLPPRGYTEGALASALAVGYSNSGVVSTLEAATRSLEPVIIEAPVSE